jgi:hypothetical protein
MLLNIGPAGASMAVAVGAAVDSAEPKLDKLTGLVCIFSTVTWSGMTMDLAALAIGSLIWAGSGGASLSRLIAVWLAAPKRF